MEPNDASERHQGTGSALEKALLVLEALAGQGRSLSASEIGALTGMPKQTAHRVVRQLDELGLVMREAVGDRYVFGGRMRQLGRASLTAPRATLATRHILESLVADIGETCNIGVLDGGKVLYVDRVECHWPLRVQLRPGSRVPSHCTAIGKLLLAYLPAAQRSHLLPTLPLASYTPNTLTSVAALSAALDEVRRAGYAINREEDSLGLNALAVPVCGQGGKVMAGLAVHAPTARLPLDAMLACRQRLEAAARQVADALFG